MFTVYMPKSAKTNHLYTLEIYPQYGTNMIFAAAQSKSPLEVKVWGEVCMQRKHKNYFAIAIQEAAYRNLVYTTNL